MVIASEMINSKTAHPECPENLSNISLSQLSALWLKMKHHKILICNKTTQAD